MSFVAGTFAALALILAIRPRRRGLRVPRGRAGEKTGSDPIESGAVAPDAVADWATDLSRELRAGRTLRAALTVAVPSDPTLARNTGKLRRELSRGSDLASTIADLDAHDPHVGLVRSVVGACATVGGAAAEPLDRTAATLRTRSADLDERAAQSAQARLSARVLTVLPLAALAFLAAGDREVREVMASTPGLVLLLAGGAANASGWWWMKHIVRSHQWGR